jgi:hypothetical protein
MLNLEFGFWVLFGFWTLEFAPLWLGKQTGIYPGVPLWGAETQTVARSCRRVGLCHREAAIRRFEEKMEKGQHFADIFRQAKSQ